MNRPGRVLGMAAVAVLSGSAGRAASTVDAVFANVDQPLEACLGDGAGGFTCHDLGVLDTTAVALEDFNDDDFTDLVVAVFGADNLFCFGDGIGAAFDCQPIGPDSGSETLDLVVAPGEPPPWLATANGGLNAERNRACVRQEGGGYVCSPLTNDLHLSFAVGLGHLDFDNALDVVFANFGATNRICHGNGDGTFSGCSDVSADTFASFDVAVGDTDGDQDHDLVFANFNGPDRHCLRANGFLCSNISNDPTPSLGVALGLLNANGKLDVVFAEAGGPSRVCLDFASTPSCAPVFAEARDAFGVELGRIDADAKVDAVFAMEDGSHQVCFGDGAGGFSACSTVGGGAEGIQGDGFRLALGELESLVFQDGFESGDTDAWSATVGE